MKAEDVERHVRRACNQYLEQMLRIQVPKEEQFQMLRRALVRGMERIDRYGAEIVNDETPASVEEIQEQLGGLFSGMIQCATVAQLMMRVAPIPPEWIRTFAMQIDFDPKAGS